MALSLGAEFPVSTGTADHHMSDNASSSNGMSVVVWVDESRGSRALRAQIYDQNHRRSGPEILIDSSPNDPTSGQWIYNSDAVAMDNNGNFVVTWSATYNDYKNSIQYVQARAYSSNGTVRPGWSKDIDIPGGMEPDVAMDKDDNFVIAYSVWRTAKDRNIEARKYRANGTLYGQDYLSTIRVAITPLDEHNPSIACSSGGNFDIAYQQDNGGNTDVYLVRYSPSGGYGRLNIATTPAREENPSVAMDYAGNSVVTWQQFNGHDWDIKARSAPLDVNYVNGRFVPRIGPMGPVLNVRSTDSDEMNPSVAMDRTKGPYGDFVVAYERSEKMGGFGSGVQEMNPWGQPLDPQGQPLGSYSLGLFDSRPSISIDGHNNYLVTFDAGITPRDVRGRFGHLN